MPGMPSDIPVMSFYEREKFNMFVNVCSCFIVVRLLFIWMDSAFSDAIRNAGNSDQVGVLVGQHIINVINIPVNKRSV